MKRFEDQDHYRVLGVNPKASAEEIGEAFARAKKIYKEGSIAIYGLHTKDEERKALFSRIEAAYKTLIYSKSRLEYDRQLEKDGVYPKAELLDLEKRTSLQEKAEEIIHPEPPRPVPEQQKPAAATLPSSYSGEGLRAYREANNISIESIADRTKIRKVYLECIETNQIDKLPGLIYAKGFIREYASCLELDPETVLEGYLEANTERFSRSFHTA